MSEIPGKGKFSQRTFLFLKKLFCLFAALSVLTLFSCSSGATEQKSRGATAEKTEAAEGTMPLSSQKAEQFDIEDYARENGFSVFFADCLNPAFWILVNGNEIRSLLSLPGFLQTASIRRESYAGMKKTEQSGMVFCELRDVSGTVLSATLSREDCLSLENALNGALKSE